MQKIQGESRSIILFDIDNTLLDTKQFASRAFEMVRILYELPQEKFDADKQAYYSSLELSTDFTPETFVDFLAETNRGEASLADPKKMVEAVSYFYEDEALQQAVFDDVIPNLQRLRNGYTLGIFSQGDKKYQLKKIENTGLIRFFEQKYIFIEKRKTTPEIVSLLPNPIVVVDDRREVLEQVANIEGLSAVHLVRNEPEGANTAAANTSTASTEFSPISTIKRISTLDHLQ